ncbi:MAG: hypothetical protein N2385_14735, partial [Chloroflexus sp.]|nr:hypothetical protein [Chloroflexus sp.]
GPRPVVRLGFNPRCGFLFFATSGNAPLVLLPNRFQSAMRIFVFCNVDQELLQRIVEEVSIRDADFCFLQLMLNRIRRRNRACFNPRCGFLFFATC